MYAFPLKEVVTAFFGTLDHVKLVHSISRHYNPNR